MEPLPENLLHATSPSAPEALLGKIPIIGWAIASAMEARRFRPIVEEITRRLTARERRAVLDRWTADQLPIVTRLMTVWEDELGWRPPHFLPDDAFLVAFWAHEDGLDDVAAVQSIENEWGIEISDQEIEACRSGDLRTFVELIRSKLIQDGHGGRRL